MPSVQELGIWVYIVKGLLPYAVRHKRRDQTVEDATASFLKAINEGCARP